MTRLLDLARGIHGRADHEIEDGADYFEICPTCGEPFDCRLFAEAIYHDQSDYHERMHTWH